MAPLDFSSASAHPAKGAIPIYDLFLDLPHPLISSSKHIQVWTPSGELSTAKVAIDLAESVERIRTFAFPEFQAGDERKLGRANTPPYAPDVYEDDDACEMFVPTNHHFSLQLSSGVRVHGHVRRYLPARLLRKFRTSAKHKNARAMILLTRLPGGLKFFLALLKSLEAISILQESMQPQRHPIACPRQAFLHRVHFEHQRLRERYAGKAHSSFDSTLSVPFMEFGPHVWQTQCSPLDALRYTLPTAFFFPQAGMNSFASSLVGTSHILPLIRSLGVSHTMRLLSALLTERRIVMVSDKPARLSACAFGAISILAQGTLEWQHVFIPILPPHLMTYLAAPMPFLIGISSTQARNLKQMRDVGALLAIFLDRNELQTFGVRDPQRTIPDLLQACGSKDIADCTSIFQTLGEDLMKVERLDKKILWGSGRIQEKIENAAIKVTSAVKKAVHKIKEKRHSNHTVEDQKNENSEDCIVFYDSKRERDTLSGSAIVEEGIAKNHHDDDYMYDYGEGSTNEAAENSARVAFGVFFVCLLGDPQWYLKELPPGNTFEIDRSKLARRRSCSCRGGEGSASQLLMESFIQSQIFEQFAKKVQSSLSQDRTTPSTDQSLFALVSTYLFDRKRIFSKANVRQTAHLLLSSKSHFDYLVIDRSKRIRQLAMDLTSNTPYQGDKTQALEKLCEECQESNSNLVDVMSVVWMRINNSGGAQWRHALLSLDLLHILLLDGPLVVITEVMNGIDTIHMLVSYENTSRLENCEQIRSSAKFVYGLLAKNRKKLFLLRRMRAEQRGLLLPS